MRMRRVVTDMVYGLFAGAERIVDLIGPVAFVCLLLIGGIGVGQAIGHL